MEKKMKRNGQNRKKNDMGGPSSDNRGTVGPKTEGILEWSMKDSRDSGRRDEANPMRYEKPGD